MSIVSLWFLYGMCCCSDASAEMTSPNADSDLLIACASLSVSPCAPRFFHAAHPRQINKGKFTLRHRPRLKISVLSMTMENIKCDRLDSTFIFVPAVLRTFNPACTTLLISSLTSPTRLWRSVRSPNPLSFFISNFGVSVPLAVRANRSSHRGKARACNTPS